MKVSIKEIKISEKATIKDTVFLFSVFSFLFVSFKKKSIINSMVNMRKQIVIE
ncbi:protein of unknown function [Tenacibaculum sp. 190524A02b]